MPFHQKVNNDARLTKMIDDLGISLNPGKPKASKDEEDREAKQNTSEEDKN
ncbi:hypothetical protein [Sporolactobacillus nakayamae]|uniref:Uncharacterized protein n=1 Tax=Sporolactobacillus nakayamae TaxID=269670 RepID=A0A1I2QES4_9BACL|nr:hypothetical protein [Sporolactobacillus nakayamae]SFG25859.1 hypothetical protein SAMN02982927_01144 [Sporolactobacillus nakayamae]